MHHLNGETHNLSLRYCKPELISYSCIVTVNAEISFVALSLHKFCSFYGHCNTQQYRRHFSMSNRRLMAR